ncbi:MAG: UDP-N-acetylglucosamine 2-epimerase (non-hydrolyzing) [Candidatus Delongbacteria bacterium]|nr:UDP-N-acetylglucosamine 2-epimerase (non-hydrolyzing) [Candidatus Delongbacteria bacterium]
MKKKIVTIIGARPQFIKAAVVSRELRKRTGIEEIIIHTGQHFDENMSKIFFDELEIAEPKYNLGISSLSQGAMTGKMIESIEKIVIDERPDLVLLYGDTNSTLAGALATVKLNIPVAHVEAGLRSFNNKMPEEINRILTDRISSLLFTPTDKATENLTAEGFINLGARIIPSGDVMYDSAILYKNNEKIPDIEIPEKFILATIHRPETTDSYENLINCINVLKNNAPFPVILSLHPRTKDKIKKYKIDTDCGNLMLIDPVSYREMQYLLGRSEFVATDSGGLQKESFFNGKYCLTLRTETEWVELVDNGTNYVCGYDPVKIIEAMDIIVKKDRFDPASYDLYGNGNASKIIVDTIIDYLN